jgi:hypothetical protein
MIRDHWRSRKMKISCSAIFAAATLAATLITTADTSGVNDGDVGQWALTAQIQAQWFDITINNFVTDTFNINDTVNVTDPVPEPSTWAMMLIGFAGLGFAAHWRRRKSVGAFAVA